ncbi:hypothetical protein NHX12_004328 [Muraenolepis orangiensis]|uniref:Uncharacterized protein n=1 Tax=Muraenolepis orangiensis TaxID=630683 RepID=A0A9Q0DWU1_9TELE|nr:hypothetical protein NHX12_004328 [Muraenolepis orangiensis]
METNGGAQETQGEGKTQEAVGPAQTVVVTPIHQGSPEAWPRYRVLRVIDVGQYNLEISRSELSDDSLYECQATEAALRSRRAKLNVLSEWEETHHTGDYTTHNAHLHPVQS